MSEYFVVKNNLDRTQISIDIYEKCLKFNHQLKDAYCPLCNRAVEGSVWEGPYQFYVRSSKLTDILFPLAPVYMLFSERFLDLLKAEGLTGIKSLKECEIFYKGARIDRTYYIPTFEYSAKAIEYAALKNEERKINKLLPRCSLCMKPNLEKDSLYFGESEEYDIFKIYDRPGTIFCSKRFYEFCNKLEIFVFKFEKIK
ncbi:MAG: hypothetical protein E7603_08255 [Ruminococcaceae bacterium]|nr:hypothetical protein [Oscillospiraceae bacterium]